MLNHCRKFIGQARSYCTTKKSELTLQVRLNYLMIVRKEIVSPAFWHKTFVLLGMNASMTTSLSPTNFLLGLKTFDKDCTCAVSFRKDGRCVCTACRRLLYILPARRVLFYLFLAFCNPSIGEGYRWRGALRNIKVTVV